MKNQQNKEEGLTNAAIKATDELPSSLPPLPGEATGILSQDHFKSASLRQPNEEEGQQVRADMAVNIVPPSSPETIEEIRYWHRQRCFAMEQRKRSDLALGAFLRRSMGWQKDLPESERKQIAKAAAAIDEKHPEYGAVAAASHQARAPFEKIERNALKQMERLATTLPVWNTFGASIRGFGAASLAVIVAEAGDLSNYASEAKLWKRMGLAVMDGIRQGGLSKGASAKDWIAHGYNAQRRSRMWNIGDALIKGNRDGAYRSLYLSRKAVEHERHPDFSPMQCHRRAQRYMEKRLLRDLWRAWNGVEGHLMFATKDSLQVNATSTPPQSEAA